MTDLINEPGYRAFVQSVIDNIKRNGFPEKKVSFPLEKMYEIAEKKGINFNKVLETLDEIQIAHSKTPEKIIFFPKPEAVTPVANAQDGKGGGSFAEMAAKMASNMDPSMFEGMDMSNMSLSGMMGMASKMMKNLTPEQLKSMKDMYKNMSEEEKQAMIEQAKKMGMF